MFALAYGNEAKLMPPTIARSKKRHISISFTTSNSTSVSFNAAVQARPKPKGMHKELVFLLHRRLPTFRSGAKSHKKTKYSLYIFLPGLVWKWAGSSP